MLGSPKRLIALWLLVLALTGCDVSNAARSPQDPWTRHVVRSAAGAWQQQHLAEHSSTSRAAEEDAAKCSMLSGWAGNGGMGTGSSLLSPASFAQRLPPGVDLGREAEQWAGHCPALHPLMHSVFAPGSGPARRAASGLLVPPAAASELEQQVQREGPGAGAGAGTHQRLKPSQQQQNQHQHKGQQQKKQHALQEQQHTKQQQQQRVKPQQQQGKQQRQGHQPAMPQPAAEPSGAGLVAPSDASKSADFNLPLARLMAQLQSIGYCSDPADIAAWNCTRCQRVPDFTAHIAHFDEAWDLMGYAGYLKSLNAKVIVFRGTDSSSWYNWAENMRAWRTDASYPVPGAPRALRIHSGFLVLWNVSSMASTFTRAFGELLEAHPTGPTYVLGHSMGGALAHLCALDLKIKYKLTDLKVYTFGAPRVGNSVFADFFQTHISESWRFTHGRDIVPSVPIQLMGFHHVSREVWLVDVDQGLLEPAERLVVCDETGEDPSCHNSVCHLGLCTSVADHLTYLGVHMFAGNEC